jgi:hypothetical protein
MTALDPLPSFPISPIRAENATGSLAGASKLEANWSRDWGRERTPDAAEVNTDY